MGSMNNKSYFFLYQTSNSTSPRKHKMLNLTGKKKVAGQSIKGSTLIHQIRGNLGNSHANIAKYKLKLPFFRLPLFFFYWIQAKIAYISRFCRCRLLANQEEVNKKFNAVAGDRTRVTRVTGGNTYHYTTTTLLP